MIMKKIDAKYLLKNLAERGISFGLDLYCLFGRIIPKTKAENEKKFWIEKLYFEVTNACNLRCRFCFYSKKFPVKTGIMSFNVFKKAIDEYATSGGKVVSFTPTIGEPLLDPGLFSKISYAASLPAIEQTYFFTNGTLLLEDDNYKRVVESGISSVRISISIFDKILYEKIHQVNFYEQTLAGISKLLQYNRANNEKISIEINFRSPLLPSQTLEIPDFKKYIKPHWGSRTSYSFMTSYDNWCGNISQNDLMGVMKLRRVNRFKYLPCVRTYNMIILFDGSVRLCAARLKDNEFEELVVGNIKNDSLFDLFYSEKAKEIRSSFINKENLSVCEKCSLYIPVTKNFNEYK